jgi:hypothetical protein
MGRKKRTFSQRRNSTGMRGVELEHKTGSVRGADRAENGEV